MLAMLQLLGAFVANLFRSRRRLEVENLFLRHQLNVALRRAPHRLQLRGSDRALLVWMTFLWPSLFGLTRSCGGIEPGFGPIGAGNRAVGQGGPELAVNCAN
jgi:hypothetical protein